jgi:hypothetical protein
MQKFDFNNIIDQKACYEYTIKPTQLHKGFLTLIKIGDFSKNIF